MSSDWHRFLPRFTPPVRAVVVVVFTLAGFVEVRAQSTQPTTEALDRLPPFKGGDGDEFSRLVNPAGDDWTTEVRGDIAKHRLADLAESLIEHRRLTTEAKQEFFALPARIGTLRPTDGRPVALGEMHVRRTAGPLHSRARKEAGSLSDPIEAFAGLLDSHRGAQGLRMELKVVGVVTVSDTAFSTEILFHAFSFSPTNRLQQNSRWSVNWAVTKDVKKPLITSIDVLQFDEISAPRSPLVDCTRAIITDDSTWSPALARGCEYWHGRIDAVGEANFMGHNGIAVGDVNGDGLDDLYIGMGTGLPNKLLIQQTDGTVRDVAVEAGVDWLDDTKGVLLIDYDNDGDQDLVLALGPVILFETNDGKGHFTPAGAARARTDGAFYSLAAADYDLDGDLDIYGCRYVEVQYGVSMPFPFQDANNGPPNILLRNDGAGRFTDATQQVGLDVNNRRFSTAAGWCDYDADGDADLYVANDFGRNNLYRNDGGKSETGRGGFVDVAGQAGAEDQAAGMGVSWSDFDNDGDFDLYVSNMYSSAGNRIAYQPRFMTQADAPTRTGVQRHSQGNTLLVNGGDARFHDTSDDAGVRMGRWAWGAMFVDINNDGFDDIVCPNGFLTGGREDDL